MKSILQALILIIIFSCGDNQSTNEKFVATDLTKKGILEKPTEIEFISDSSYVKYWCSTEILKDTAESIDKLELSVVANFLATFHKDCMNNVEYSEWSNELLFEITNRNPGFILQLLYKNSSLDKELIKSNFESPIHDRFEIDEIIGKIEKTSSPMKIKNEIIAALKIAKLKH
jgi:hypothetical protein